MIAEENPTTPEASGAQPDGPTEPSETTEAPTPADNASASAREAPDVPPADSPAESADPTQTPQTPAKPDAADGDADVDSQMAEFDSQIGSYLDGMSGLDVGSLVVAPVVSVRDEHVLVDLGEKSEGLIPIEELTGPAGQLTVAPGDRIDVMIVGRDPETGLLDVSHRKARTQAAWARIVESQNSETPLPGKVLRAVKSGLLVDVGVQCFMPASQIDITRVENLEDWVGRDVEALVIETDERKHRAILSRRRLLEQQRQKALQAALEHLHEGDAVTGTVRSVRNFGAFLGLGDVDAFLPREEVSWERGAAPSHFLKVGDQVEARVIQVDRQASRIKVSRKATMPNPWDTAAEKYPVGAQVEGEVVSITRFGAFVRIEEGLTGLIHISDMSWSKGQQRPADHVKEGDRVTAAVVSVEQDRSRMSLGLKQLVEDPWIEAEKRFPKGTKVKGAVTGLVDFGAFVRLTDEIEGLIHISDFAWDRRIKHPGEILEVGNDVEAVVLKTDRASRRVSLGIKQLTESPIVAFLRDHSTGSAIEGEVVRLIDTGAFVNLAPGIDGFMHISQIDRERVEKVASVLKVGDEVRCKITKIERNSGRIAVSRKALLEAEEAQAIRDFSGQADSGVMKLGDLLQGLDIQTTEED